MTLRALRMIEGEAVDHAQDIQPAASLTLNQQLTAQALLPGELCPWCQSAPLDYDGLLNLTCPQCGYSLGGFFT